MLCSEQIYHKLGVGYPKRFSCERGFAGKPIQKNHLSPSYILEVIQKSREWKRSIVFDNLRAFRVPLLCKSNLILIKTDNESLCSEIKKAIDFRFTFKWAYAMGRKMKEEGKWCETSVIIIMIEKKNPPNFTFNCVTQIFL